MAEDNTRSRGVVSNINDQKGCGFIKHDDDDLFVHPSEGFRALRADQAVKFVVASEKDKTEAGDVTGPNGDPVDPVCGGDGGDFGGRNSGDGGDGGGDRDLGFSEKYRTILNGNGVECHNCGGTGHIDEECDREASEASLGCTGGGGCYYCGNPGHLVSECDSQYRIVEGRVFCVYCGLPGHIASECLCYIPPCDCSVCARESGHM